MTDCANALAARQVLRINGTPTRALGTVFRSKFMNRLRRPSVRFLMKSAIANKEYPFSKESRNFDI